ncbi:ParB/RepB/Spo0J family partition protein [Pseudomonas amygdali]|uniref:ParB/RepB/Spo0J family partition protein n=1 Tax=Pseudomonas amygdali TaxID=47877 RepID=UPI000C31ED22|nr:hypothetical protein [Pseudomonas amygdali]PWD01927.1 hypothetical protein CX658_18375 [Pseudomonas amygdali pv. lachrymans]
MTAMATNQIQLAIDNFDLTLNPGSVKTIMAGIKAAYEPKDEKKGADKALSDGVQKVMSGIQAIYEGKSDESATGIPQIKGAGGSSDLWKVPVKELKVLKGFNVRLPGPDLDQHIAELTDSILEEGFMQHKPLAALVLEIDGVLGLYVFDGHCRLESTIKAIAKGAEIDLLPVVVQDGRNTNLDDLYVTMYRANKGKELAPFELGVLCKRLSRNGHDDKVIAKRMGIKPGYVDGLLRLVNSPKALVDAVLSTEIAASEAITMLRAHGNGAVVQELENRRARALAEMQAKAPAGQENPAMTGDTAEQEAGTTTPARPRITARHASDAHVKKAVRKHGLELFKVNRLLKEDPAYANLSEATRLQLEKFIALLDEAEKADALPPVNLNAQGEDDMKAAA